MLHIRIWDDYMGRYQKESHVEIQSLWVLTHDVVGTHIELGTPIKDKNNKRVYEGDIVKAISGHEYKVIWDGLMFSLKRKKDKLPLLSTTQLEVVGNVNRTVRINKESNGDNSKSTNKRLGKGSKTSVGVKSRQVKSLKSSTKDEQSRSVRKRTPVKSTRKTVSNGNAIVRTRKARRLIKPK